MVEYALLLSLVALALVGTIGGMAGQVGGRFNAISNTLASGGNGGSGGGGSTTPGGGGTTPPPSSPQTPPANTSPVTTPDTPPANSPDKPSGGENGITKDEYQQIVNSSGYLYASYSLDGTIDFYRSPTPPAVGSYSAGGNKIDAFVGNADRINTFDDLKNQLKPTIYIKIWTPDTPPQTGFDTQGLSLNTKSYRVPAGGEISAPGGRNVAGYYGCDAYGSAYYGWAYSLDNSYWIRKESRTAYEGNFTFNAPLTKANVMSQIVLPNKDAYQAWVDKIASLGGDKSMITYVRN